MSFSRYDLLPPNATQLERDLSRSISSLVRTEQPVPVIRTAKRIDTPESVIPWLIYEYGLGELLPYITDRQQAIKDGVLWQRIRGTPESVRVALGWIGIEGVIEEPEGGTARWAEYMLGLANPAENEATIDRIVGVAKISSPVRSRLQRIYAGYDFRRAVYDNCSWSDGSIYSDHSGVRLRPDWPQISYGLRLGLLVESSASVAISHNEAIGILVDSDDRFRYDYGKWGDRGHAPNHEALISTDEGLSATYEGQVWGPFVWQQKSWNAINVVCSINVTTLSYVQLLLHMDGSSFVDSSSFGRTVTPSGTVALVSDYSFSGQSAYQPISAGPGFPDNFLAISPINIGANDDFFIEMWCRPASVSNAGLMGNDDPVDWGANQQILAILNGQLYHVNSNYISSTGDSELWGGTVVANTGQWLAVGRTNNTVRLFVDGVVVATGPNRVGSLKINRIGWSVYRTPYTGFYDEVRITAGPAGSGAGLHTSSYAPPVGPFIDA